MTTDWQRIADEFCLMRDHRSGWPEWLFAAEQAMAEIEADRAK